MTNVVSRLREAIETWSFKYNCYEAVHPWTPYCSDSALELGATVFYEAIKLYTPLYLVPQLLQRRFDQASFTRTSTSILRSTSFISANAFFALLFFCTSRNLTAKFYYYAVAYVPGFVASSMAVLIEKPSRRSSLAFYVANVASEALFRIAVSRNYVKPLPHGQVYLFTASMAVLMMLAKRDGFDEDPLSGMIKLIVGPEEAKPGKHRRSSSVDALSATTECSRDNEINGNKQQVIDRSNKTLARMAKSLQWLGSLLGWAPHQLCPHQHCSCLAYVTKASLRAFLIGYTGQLALKLATKAPQIIREPSLFLTTATEPSILKLGFFLSTFAGLYKASNCTLRHLLNTSNTHTCFLSALIAGPALLIYPSPTVALYVTWKCLEALFNEAVDRKLIKNKNLFVVVLYGLATSQLFYSALMDPSHMKKSYMGFMDRISHHKLHMVNRSVLDIFGTNASAGYEDFFPDLHPKFMSGAFLGSIWIWMLENKAPFSKLSPA